MITYVTLPEATANIVQLLDRVAQGEEIIISQAGRTLGGGEIWAIVFPA